MTSGPPHSHQDDAPSKADAASLQKKANEAQARIGHDNGDSDQLIKAVETNNVSLAKKILLKNGFTAKDFENAKISLRTGGGKRGDQVKISITCCDGGDELIIIQSYAPSLKH